MELGQLEAESSHVHLTERSHEPPCSGLTGLWAAYVVSVLETPLSLGEVGHGFITLRALRKGVPSPWSLLKDLIFLMTEKKKKPQPSL